MSPHGLEEQQIAARFQHPPELGQDTLLRRIAIVVKHRDRDHDVECPGVVGNPLALEAAEIGAGPPGARQSHHRLDQVDAAVQAVPSSEERHPAARAAAVVEESAAPKREEGLESVECCGEDALLNAVNARVLDRIV
jgi:hypothetical protein